METWKTILGYETHYEVSNIGNVRRIAPGTSAVIGKNLKPGRMTVGYLFVALCMHGKPKLHSIHRLVAGAFIGPCPDGHEVNHKNGVRTDNRLENLEYVTRKQN